MNFFSPSFLIFASVEKSLVGKKFGHNTALVLDFSLDISAVESFILDVNGQK